jgi:nucleotide-binding universal stress UspA family protein
MLAAEEYLESMAREISREGLQADFVVEAAEDPSEAIARLAGELDADLIAIATHGYGGVKRVVMGSVADAVLRATPLPLLVMRPKYQAE